AGVALDVETALSGIGGPGLMVVMIMAALAITTEYRFSTIRSSFLAAPGRFGLLGAKAVVVSAVSGAGVAVAAAPPYLAARGGAGTVRTARRQGRRGVGGLGGGRRARRRTVVPGGEGRGRFGRPGPARARLGRAVAQRLRAVDRHSTAGGARAGGRCAAAAVR